jgi:hypothetical protein
MAEFKGMLEWVLTAVWETMREDVFEKLKYNFGM